MPSNYLLCGLHVCCDIALPGLLPWPGDGAADIAIRLGPVPDRLPGVAGKALQVAPGGTLRVAIDDVASFLLEEGRSVTVAPAGGCTDRDLALFLLGSIFGLLCHQRGLYPLHASTVAIGGRAFAFAGDSGAGKSTTAAALLELGHTLLSDDISVIDLNAGGHPRILPASPTQKLWRDSLAALDIAPGERIRADPGMDKFERHVAHGFQPTALPLAAICHLEPGPHDGSPLLRPVLGTRAVRMLRDQIYRLEAAQIMGEESRLFLQSATIASAVPQFVLRRPRALDQAREFARQVSDTLQRIDA